MKIPEAGVEEYVEYAPVTESGAMYKPRSRVDAEKCMAEWPAGATYSDGGFGDGITHIVKRTVRIERGEWERHE